MHDLPAALSAFLASLVEFVEALTVILAVAAVRGWRPALQGAVLGLALLLLLIALFGPALTLVPLGLLRLMIGLLLLLFGLRWLRKAILRSAGLIGLHDEAAVFATESEKMRHEPDQRDWPAVAAACQIVLLEGGEVLFIVLALGAAGGQWRAAACGAGLALLVVALLGVLLHRPLTRVPENSLKFIVGLMLTAFGCFWTGEAIGLPWPGGDWALPALVAMFAATALAARSVAIRSA